MKKTLSLLCLLFVTTMCGAKTPAEIPSLGKIFDKYAVSGSILIYNQNEKTYSGYNLDRCNHPFSPASTFKICNTLIALETGVVTPETVFKWDGTKQRMPGWEQDLNIEKAFKESSVPVYQEIARQIGTERMNRYIRLFQYGEMDINEQNIDKFWLEGESAITQYQQIYFLQKLYNLQLPASDKAMMQTKEIMLQEENEHYKLSYKTGWATRQKENVTWLVGYIETGDNVYYFATNVEPGANADLTTFGQVRINLTKEIFRNLNIIR